MKCESILDGVHLAGVDVAGARFNHDACTPAARGTSPARRDLWHFARIWWRRWVRLSRHAPRRLRLCESLPLGERRFVAVVEFEQARFLVGGTSTSLVLLARLENRADEIAPPRANQSAMEEQTETETEKDRS